MIKLNQLQFQYKDMQMYFDLQVKAQEKIAIIGASGAGKSTLLNLIAGFEQGHAGKIWLNGENHTQTEPHLRPVSMLFQDNNLFPHLTVEQNLRLGIHPSLKLNRDEKQRLQHVASAVGLQAFLNRKPTALSGGQKQRVAIARCLLRDKPILLLDEPFSALDPQLRQEMLNLIDGLCTEKKLTLLLVTHQPSELAERFDQIICVENGKIKR
ncbi:thiamine ABC transporter ATP-binding protein [Actinobacillus porcinus]|uniref:thiamine ABC transporter ATP-binding protein n=1 Tax=Actinobacillus porcinus TaxID=51048 RepID=UPI003B5C5211